MSIWYEYYASVFTVLCIILCYNAKISIDNTGLNRDLDYTLHELLSGDVVAIARVLDE